MSKRSIAVVFGGQSSEHDISCISVQTVAKAINKDAYDITYIGDMVGMVNFVSCGIPYTNEYFNRTNIV